MKTKPQQPNRQSGAVALFVVIFATLLMTIITISFIQLMLKDQQQATASDLSQSAYDSAQSGVEDAKRLLLMNQQCQNGTLSSTVNCSQVTTSVNSGECNTLSFGLYGRLEEDSEVMVQQSEGDTALQQAYTCVKIDPTPNDYKLELNVNESNVVPLKGVSVFDTVELSWFTSEDVSSTPTGMTIGFPSPPGEASLPYVDTWGENSPSLVRAQFMQTGEDFTLNEFNDSAPGNRSNANTLFLYPSEAGGTNLDFAADVRRVPTGGPELVRCSTSFTSVRYACTARLKLPLPINGSVDNRNAYLRLSALYNGMNYQLRLLNGSTVVPFDGVQAEVDSTGRANDMFRRVVSRIELRSDFMYPEAALDIEGDLCKNFSVIDRDPLPTESFGRPSTTCTP